MVIGQLPISSEFYPSFQGPFVVEEAPQSSEDGSGLHSPTFMDSEALDGHRNDFRAPPPDLDVHNVADLLASHFSTVEPPTAIVSPYQAHYNHMSGGEFQYPPSYMNHTSSLEYEHDRRYSPRTTRGMYGTTEIRTASPPPYFSGGFQSGKISEAPRPLTIPSLLPSNPSPQVEDRVYISNESEVTQQQYTKTMTPSDGAASPIDTRSIQAEPSGSSHPRREPSLVVIACRQCRARKIRCDSTRPACNNCVRRQNECQYDSVPKRRGPDKRPGTRQRSCKKRPVDGSMPAKKKHKKTAVDQHMHIHSPIVIDDASGEAAGQIDESVSSAGSLSAGMNSSVEEEMPMSMMTGPESGYVPIAGMANMSVHPKPQMGLRLDMNFMNRSPPSQAMYSAELSSAQSHPHSAHSYQYPSASGSPTTVMSIQTPIPHSAQSPDMSLLKSHSPRHRGPFSMYDELSSDTMSDSDSSGRVFTRQLNLSSSRSDERVYLSSPPLIVDFNTKLWWDNLLTHYSPVREHSEAIIMKDLTFLFNNSIHWLSFLNERHFFRTLLDPSEREKMQPSLVLSALALATLLQSSELGLGRRGRERALWLRDTAQSFLEAAWNVAIVDPALAQAAMLIAIFESSAHPRHSAERACGSLMFLDQIIRALALTAIDAGDPNASVYSPLSVPSVPRPGAHDITLEERCYCAPPVHSPQLDMSIGGRLSPNWSSSIRWDPSWNHEEIQREETRRLCWAALSLSAAHTAHCAAFHTEPLDLFLSRPENYALLFPGERGASVDATGGPNYSPKQSVWALYCRSMLLWNSCLRLRKSASDTDKAEFSMNAWLEAQDVQDALDSHSCSTDSHLIFMTREHLFNTRIAVSFEFRRLQDIDMGRAPMFNRRQAEDWIYYQGQTAKRFEIILHDGRDPQAQVLARRPFYVWWFMSQLAISMSLWVYDNTLVQALDLCKVFLVPLDILSALWPCPAQRDQYLALRKELAGHCDKAGLNLPPPPDFSLPISMRT